jgi:Tfp pilus assembly protein PilN
MTLVFVFIFAVLLVVYLLTLGQAVMASNRVEIIKAENAKVEQFTTKLKPYDERKKALDERKKIVDTMTANQVMWSSVLNDVSMVIPNDIWLKDVKINIKPIIDEKKATASSVKAKPEPPITLVGYAFNHAAVARWLVHLNEINQFRGVWLDSARETEIPPEAAPLGTTTSTAKNIRVIEFQTTVYLTKFKEESAAK